MSSSRKRGKGNRSRPFAPPPDPNDLPVIPPADYEHIYQDPDSPFLEEKRILTQAIESASKKRVKTPTTNSPSTSRPQSPGGKGGNDGNVPAAATSDSNVKPEDGPKVERKLEQLPESIQTRIDTFVQGLSAKYSFKVIPKKDRAKLRKK